MTAAEGLNNRAFEAALDASMDGVAILDETGQYRYLNEQHARVYGYDSTDDLVGKHWSTLYDDEYCAYLEETAMKSLASEGHWRGEAIGMRKDGTRFPQEVSLSLMDSGLVCVVRDITQQQGYERRLKALYDATSHIVSAASTDEIGKTTVEIAQEVLEHPLSGMWEYKPETDTLEIVAMTDSIDEALQRNGIEGGPHPMGPGTVEWEIFKTGEATIIDDYEAIDNPSHPGVGLRTVLMVPLDDTYQLGFGLLTTDGFTPSERYMLDILAQTTRVALERVEREVELSRRVDQLEFLNSLLRHDILNGMLVIKARGDILYEEVEDEQHRKYADAIRRWSDDIVSLTQRVRTLLDALTADEPPTMVAVDLAPLITHKVEKLEATYPETTFELSLLHHVPVMGTEILTEVVGNILVNTLKHGRDTAPEVILSMTEQAETVRLYIADNGPGVPDDQKRRIFGRDITSTESWHTGTGFGLYFVDVMVRQYGGRVWVEDNEPTGAVFVIELQKAAVIN